MVTDVDTPMPKSDGESREEKKKKKKCEEEKVWREKERGVE